jgi:hypothetical protein
LVEYGKWRQFESEHPFPSDLIDLHGAMLCSIIVNLVRAEGSTPQDMKQFLLLRKRSVEDIAETEEVTEASKFASMLGR